MTDNITPIINAGLGIASIFFPQFAIPIGIAMKVIPWIGAAEPLIVAAIKEGVPAIHAAEAAAPGITTAVKDLVNQLPTLGVNVTGGSNDAKVENIVRTFVGIPHMTFDEEKAWMDKTTEFLEDSRSGSA